LNPQYHDDKPSACSIHKIPAMKVLYAIQGTGNGHISRARDIIPVLNNYCETDILLSGSQADVALPHPVHYRYKGLSFIFGKNGGVDMWNTYVEANQKQLMSEIRSVPVEKYDFVINDFEPVSAWACYIKKVPCISLSHQAAVLDKNAPQPKQPDPLGRFILKNYAPSNVQFGFHFSRYAPHIYTPVIRQEIRNAKVTDKGHYTVYLPAYDDEKIIRILSRLKEVKWQVFSKHNHSEGHYGHIHIMPIQNERFIESLQSCTGTLTGAGFETPAEALHLGKKLMVIPMKAQYEQQCNAKALKTMGVPVAKKFNEKRLPKIREWIDSDTRIEVAYPDSTQAIIKQIFEEQVLDLLKKNNWNYPYRLTFAPETEKHEPDRSMDPVTL